MDYQNYSQQILEQLSVFNFRKEESDDSNLLVFRSQPTKTEEKDHDEGLLLLLLLLRIDDANHVVFAKLKATVGGAEVPSDEGLKDILILNVKDNLPYPISSVIQTVANITQAFGYRLVESDEDISKHTPTPVYPPEQDKQDPTMPTTWSTRPPGVAPGHANEPSAKKNSDRGNKKAFILILIGLLVIAIIVGLIMAFRPKGNGGDTDNSVSSSSADHGKSTTDSGDNTPSEGSKTSNGNASDVPVISAGVDVEDSGNAVSNQIYFDAGDTAFYSCSDKNNQNHIYALDKKSGETRIIFDGFGWSFTVFDDQVYFSGNPGPVIDSTYNIYRMNTDGSGLEKINDKYSHGLFFFRGLLYFLERDERDYDYETSFHLYRMDPKTLEKQKVKDYCKNALIYKGRIYFVDSSGNVYGYDTNLQNPIVSIGYADVKTFVISHDKFYYVDHNNNIKSCDLDGKNMVVLREHNQSNNIFSLIAYNGKLYFSELDPYDFDYDAYAYQTALWSMEFDGSGAKQLHSYRTISSFINVVGNRIYALVQRRPFEGDSSYAAVYIESVALTGGDNHYLQR